MDWTQAMASSIGVLEIFRAILRIFTRLMGPLVLRRFFTARAGSLELSESPSLASTCISFQNQHRQSQGRRDWLPSSGIGAFAFPLDARILERFRLLV